MSDCKKTHNASSCACTYEPCSKKGVCCDCLTYHLRMRQLPGCCFSAEAEKTFDRSFEHFAKLVTAQRI